MAENPELSRNDFVKVTVGVLGGIMGAAEIQPAQCQGCGTCVAECPAKAIELLHYTDSQVYAKIDALFASEDFVPVGAIGLASH